MISAVQASFRFPRRGGVSLRSRGQTVIAAAQNAIFRPLVPAIFVRVLKVIFSSLRYCVFIKARLGASPWLLASAFPLCCGLSLALAGTLAVLPLTAWADRLVLITPHWEGIRHEFERAFKAHYQSETGRAVALDWMDVGGTSETLRYIESEFKNKPKGIGIDIFFGGGYDPFLALKKSQLLERYKLPAPMLAQIPAQLGGVPLYEIGRAHV